MTPEERAREEEQRRQARKRQEKLDASERLVVAFSEDDAERLDEEVHEVKAREAASINNEGLASQIDCLLDAGYAEQDIRELLEG